jgi:hypothetical protein
MALGLCGLGKSLFVMVLLLYAAVFWKLELEMFARKKQ